MREPFGHFCARGPRRTPLRQGSVGRVVESPSRRSTYPVRPASQHSCPASAALLPLAVQRAVPEHKHFCLLFISIIYTGAYTVYHMWQCILLSRTLIESIWNVRQCILLSRTFISYVAMYIIESNTYISYTAPPTITMERQVRWRT